MTRQCRDETSAARGAKARLRRAHHRSAHTARSGGHASALPTLQSLVICPRLLVWNPVDRALGRPRGRARHRLDHFAGAFGIGDPFRTEVVGTGRQALGAFAGIDHAINTWPP